MNARAVKKRLLKNAQRVLWGRRAYIGVRFPLNGVLPERPLGVCTPPGFVPSEWSGMWVKDNGDGTEDVLSVSQLSCGGGQPVPPEDKEGVTRYHIEPNRWGSGWQWWTVSWIRYNAATEERTEQKMTPEFESMVARQAYEFNKWVEQLRFGEDNTDAFYHLMLPEWSAKTYYLYHDDNYYYLIWSVKYFYAYWLRKFSALFRTSIMRLKKLGVEVKVVDSEPANAVFLC